MNHDCDLLAKQILIESDRICIPASIYIWNENIHLVPWRFFRQYLQMKWKYSSYTLVKCLQIATFDTMIASHTNTQELQGYKVKEKVKQTVKEKESNKPVALPACCPHCTHMLTSWLRSLLGLTLLIWWRDWASTRAIVLRPSKWSWLKCNYPIS